MADNERMLIDLTKTSIQMVPFTYVFLGLRLRLAFTKRRFEKVEATYLEHLTTSIEQGGDGAGAGQINGGILHILESSFSSLRDEIGRIEQGHESMKERALPKVREQLQHHECFITCFLSGFRERGSNNSSVFSEECHLPMLNQGEETTTAIKKLIAEFAGIPIGMVIHDLRSLELLLVHGYHGYENIVVPALQEALEVPNWIDVENDDARER
jgi:hypothetical protein